MMSGYEPTYDEVVADRQRLRVRVKDLEDDVGFEKNCTAIQTEALMRAEARVRSFEKERDELKSALERAKAFARSQTDLGDGIFEDGWQRCVVEEPK